MMKIDLLGLNRMWSLFSDDSENNKKDLIDDKKIMIDPVYKLCRHPMQAGFIGLFIFSSCNYTLGRVLYIVCMLIGITIGVNEEEKFLQKNEIYLKIVKIVKNKFLPDFTNLFSDQFKEIEELNLKKNK